MPLSSPPQMACGPSACRRRAYDSHYFIAPHVPHMYSTSQRVTAIANSRAHTICISHPNARRAAKNGPNIGRDATAKCELMGTIRHPTDGRSALPSANQRIYVTYILSICQYICFDDRLTLYIYKNYTHIYVCNVSTDARLLAHS